MEKLATIILNRNLPLVTSTLFNTIKKYNKNYTDIFVVEAGSKKKNLSKISTWHANWPKARKEGLRYGRGANYALSNLYKEDKFKNYKGPLFIYETSGRPFRNIPTFSICCFNSLNLLKLAPGGHVGRFCIWSYNSFLKLENLSKK